ncbi:MAG TPA: M56 family metallopeptidase, partial [Verrucomicrobiae bacterium]|nr:M56 family metallopeptidase [Verrucomicrobiae bacterium]
MNPLIECLGWTLVHFLWQGLAIALLLAIGLGLLRQRPPNHRYLAGCAALLLMAIAPGITFYFIEQRLQSSPAPAVEPASSVPDSIESKLHSASPGLKVIFTAKPVTGRPSFTERLEMFLPWLVVGWSVGVLALSCRLLAGWLQVRRMQRRAIETLAEPWHLKLAELAQRLSISRPVRLFKSAMVEVPTVIGWLRPVILLPASCLAGLTPTQLESILAHELAHIRRHDYLVNMLQSILETLLFYHPAVWWVSRCVREERENCCDDIAVKICGDPVAYARALATLEEMRPASAQLALAASGAPLLQRIQRLLGKSARRTSLPAWPLAGIIIAIMIMALATNLRGGRAVVADSLTPETFLTGLGVYHYTNNNSVLELTIRSNQLLLAS